MWVMDLRLDGQACWRPGRVLGVECIALYSALGPWTLCGGTRRVEAVEDTIQKPAHPCILAHGQPLSHRVRDGSIISPGEDTILGTVVVARPPLLPTGAYLTDPLFSARCWRANAQIG